MDRTQAFDQPADPNRTQAIGVSADPSRTQAMGMPVDPNRTQAVPGLGAHPTRALTMNPVLGRPVALANSIAREGLLVEITGAQTATGRAPLNLCLVIDRSGSMEGTPLEYVKRACSYVVDLLGDQDVLSIVTFEETVEVLMPPRKIVNKQLVKEHLNRLTPGNTTNLYDGLVLGIQQVTSVNLPGYQSHLMLFTDGEPTVGIKDFSTIVGVAARAKEHHFHITALGFGPDYNEELLAGIARRSGGKYYYIDRPERIPEIFQQELQRLMTVVARNLKLEVQLARWVQVRQAFGGELHLRGRTAELSLVDVERGSQLTPILELEFPNHPAGIYRIARLKLTYEDNLTGAPRRSRARWCWSSLRPCPCQCAPRPARGERTAARCDLTRTGENHHGDAHAATFPDASVAGAGAHPCPAHPTGTHPGSARGHASHPRPARTRHQQRRKNADGNRC
jgi:Ca-activated chloride channel family protein